MELRPTHQTSYFPLKVCLELLVGQLPLCYTAFYLKKRDLVVFYTVSAYFIKIKLLRTPLAALLLNRIISSDLSAPAVAVGSLSAWFLDGLVNYRCRCSSLFDQKQHMVLLLQRQRVIGASLCFRAARAPRQSLGSPGPRTLVRLVQNPGRLIEGAFGRTVVVFKRASVLADLEVLAV